MLGGGSGILEAPQQLVYRTPLFVQGLYWTDRFIRPPELVAQRAFPQLESRQVYLVMACPSVFSSRPARFPSDVRVRNLAGLF
jgi:hypothetical protein